MSMHQDLKGLRAATSWSDRIQAVGQGVFVLALFAAILPYGGVTPVPFAAAFLAVAAAAGLGSLTPPQSRRARGAYHLSMALCLLLALLLLVQAWSFPGNPLGNSIWAEAGRLVGALPAAISVDPWTTRAAIFPLVMPFLIYGAALALFPTDEAAFRLIAILGAVATLFALFGLVQVSLLPRSLLFTEKLAYLDSLTSVFVNRNTAATLLGVGALACLTLLMRMVRQVSGSSPFLRLFSDSGISTGRRLRASLLLFCLATCLLALLLTRSRGAAISTALAFLVILPMLFQDAGRYPALPRKAVRGAQQWRILFRVAASVALVASVVFLFGGQMLLRLETRGFDPSRLCVYAATLSAIRDNWLLGTGFGTFETVFPAYRTLGCGSPYDTFQRAHNVFLEGMLGLGIAFVPLCLLVYAHLARVLGTGLRNRRRLRFVPIIAIGAVVLVTLHSLVDFSVQIPGMAAYLAAYLGATTTISLGRPSGARRARLARRYEGAD